MKVNDVPMDTEFSMGGRRFTRRSVSGMPYMTHMNGLFTDRYVISVDSQGLIHAMRDKQEVDDELDKFAK